jgi:hypothetical protein
LPESTDEISRYFGDVEPPFDYREICEQYYAWERKNARKTKLLITAFSGQKEEFTTEARRGMEQKEECRFCDATLLFVSMCSVPPW